MRFQRAWPRHSLRTPPSPMPNRQESRAAATFTARALSAADCVPIFTGLAMERSSERAQDRLRYQIGRLYGSRCRRWQQDVVYLRRASPGNGSGSFCSRLCRLATVGLRARFRKRLPDGKCGAPCRHRGSPARPGRALEVHGARGGNDTQERVSAPLQFSVDPFRTRARGTCTSRAVIVMPIRDDHRSASCERLPVQEHSCSSILLRDRCRGSLERHAAATALALGCQSVGTPSNSRARSPREPSGGMRPHP